MYGVDMHFDLDAPDDSDQDDWGDAADIPEEEPEMD